MVAGTGGVAGGSPGPCPAGNFPTADPTKAGPFAVTTENNVGPDGAFTLVRPTSLTQSGLCHPVVTWGNGHGTTPNIYSRLLNQLASHGFVVIASNSSMVSMGDPPPMLAGVTWVVEQNADPASVLYGHIDTAHIGATGHSEGALATMRAGADARITAIAPIEGSMSSRNLHGPALLMCGGMDTTLPCSGHVTSFNGITNQPVMVANQLAATHANWMGFGGGGNSALNPFIVAATGWMRVHLMGDVALRPMFYGATCTLCQDKATWEVMQKMLD
jgi:predicted dienelactone hydrolase